MNVFSLEMPSTAPLPASGIVILSGVSGSGKTKRMQREARLFSMQKGSNFLHCCSLDLAQKMADAVNSGEIDMFRVFMMRLDALFIDNIWLLKRRPRTARALFSLFESFANRGGWVVMADDGSPPLFAEWIIRDRAPIN